MKSASLRVFALLFAALTSAFAKPPCHNPRKAHESCDARIQVIEASSATPVLAVNAHTLIVRYVNPLRFRYTLGSVATSINAPAVPGSLALAPNTVVSIPKTASELFPPGAERSPGITARNLGDEIQQPFDSAVRAATAASDNLAQSIQALNASINAVNAEQRCYNDLLARLSAPILTAPEQISLRKAAAANQAAGPGSCRLSGTRWPTDYFAQNEGELRGVQNQLTGITLLPGYKAWAADAANSAAFTIVNNAVNANIALAQSKQTPAPEFLKTVSNIDSWRQRLGEIDQRMKDIEAQTSDFNRTTPADRPTSPFIYSGTVDCSNSFYGKGTTLTVTLNATDITSATPVSTPLQILTNTCYPPGTISTGIGFSLLHDRVYAFQPSPDPANPASTISTIQTTTDAIATPLYSVQYNISAKEWPNGNGLHASIGTALGSTSGTSSFELLAGPSFSFRHRAFFITPAFQLARRDQLNNGYHVGSPAGNGLNSLPITTNYKPGFAITFTFGIGN